MGGLITGVILLGVACFLVWHVGVPLAGSLYRLRRKANRPTPHPRSWYTRGHADREVSPLESVPGAPDDGLDAMVAADPLLAKLARKTRA